MPADGDRARARREAARRVAVRRRRVAAGLVALAAVLASGVAIAASRLGTGPAAHVAHPAATARPTSGPATTTKAAARPAVAKVAAGHVLTSPGKLRVVTSGPASSKGVALTFDDGFCTACIGALVHGVESTGAHVTFCPNGAYDRAWHPYAARIRALIARGQVEMCNHTFTHAYLRSLSAAAVRTELQRNETWIKRTFGVSSKPLFRPPYGAYSSATLSVAGSLGYTRVLMWSGTFADSSQRTHAYLIRAIRYWGKAGAIILGHGNYPGTGAVMPQVVKLLTSRGLQTMTVSELLAGHRSS
jgi:peptidoglycan/xylan/chitin deacetylase (PgdA/CDA1 family)